MTILRYWFLSLAILLVAVVGWRSSLLLRPSASVTPSRHAVVPMPTAQPAPAPETPASPEQRLAKARIDILARLADVPQFDAFYKDLSAAFPHLYADFVDSAVRALATGGPSRSSAGLLWDALRDLQQSNGILAAKADADALGTFFDARLSMLDVLASADPRTCADFLYGTTDPAIEGFSIAHRDLVAEMARKQLAAIEDGQREHLDPVQPTPEDIELVAGGLAAKKLNPDEISMLLDGKPIDPPLPDARQCEIGRTYLSVLKDLPPLARRRIYGFAAELLARS